MRKMLYANFCRLWKDKVFWITAAAMLVFSLANVFDGMKNAAQPGFSYTLEHYLFGFLPMFGAFAAAFISLFQGTEYNDGTLRNKLIIGHTRTKLYFANFLANCVGSAIILTIGFLAGMVGVPVIGWLRLDTAVMVSYLICSFLMAGVWSALFTLIVMLAANKAYGAVFCILFWLGFTFFGSYFHNALCEPEMNSGGLLTMEGMTMSEPTPNPDYVGGFKRQVYEFLADFFPSTQSIQMSNLKVSHPYRMMLCSAGITIAAVLGGVLCFRKKDIR